MVYLKNPFNKIMKKYNQKKQKIRIQIFISVIKIVKTRNSSSIFSKITNYILYFSYNFL